MQFEYFEDTDTLSLSIGEGEVETTEDMLHNLLIDYGGDCCTVLHLEILNARHTLYDCDPSKFRYRWEANGRHVFELTSAATIDGSDTIKTDEHPNVEIRHRDGKWIAIVVRE